MRFFEDGPDIPDALIEARELGEVVFFCGAGVSAPAGLPDFGGLADTLLNKLTAIRSRRAREDGESLDRVFTEMVKEFGGQAVDRELSIALRAPRRAKLEVHRAIIDLSRGADGAAKIVTTNFDLLFERADRALRGYVPPTLPDLTQLQPIRGVVYLHGRLSTPSDTRSGYVISSADFGRAYLAEGWAARFVRDLSDRYTIVLLGYSANDPPMRYLLEGLSSRERDRRPIYAFAPEGPAAADESWRDKGVTTIPYAPRTPAHDGLWDSVFAWAGSARDRDGWRDRLVELAGRQPATLRPFERGQVMHLVGGSAGAAAFGQAKPPPPAEWLCVLDANRRYAKPTKVDWNDENEVDPLDLFGLDSDPPRPAPRPGGGVVPPGEDPIRWRRGDETWPDRTRLTGHHPEWSSQLPPRLFRLASWFGSVMDQPAAVWWASTNGLPHPGLTREIEHRLSHGDPMPEQATRFWRCYLETVASRQQNPDGHRLYAIADRLKKEGWDDAALRELERAVMPVFEIAPPVLNGPCPPSGDWDTVRFSSLTDIKVTVAAWPDGLIPPPDRLAKVVATLRRSLVQTAEMLKESTVVLWRTPTLFPTGEPGEQLGRGRKSGHFLMFRTLFDALAAHDVDAARAETASWDSGDPVFFAKLFLYATTLPGVFEAEAKGAKILAMPAHTFWDHELTRELLHALRHNWPHLSPRTRRRIERRIIAGPARRDGEERRDHPQRRKVRAASWLRWLELNGRSLSAPTSAILPELKAADPRWSDEWAWSADQSLGSFGGMIRRVTDSQGLEEAPLAGLVELAESLSTDDHRQLRDYRPFDGVVEVAPFLALAALRLKGRRGQWPEVFWRSLISNYPENRSPRLTRLLGHAIARLPDRTFAAVRFEAGDWVRKFAGGLIRNDRRAGLAVYDAIEARFMVAPAELLGSGVGTTTVGGVPKRESEFSIMKAINAPGGDLAGTILGLLDGRRRRGAMPHYIGSRIMRLLDLPGDGAGHAAALVARQFGWLDYCYRDWTRRLVPMFELDHPLAEAMWSGLSSDPNLISDDAGGLLKPSLLRLIAGEAPWELDDEAGQRIVQQMVNLTLARPKTAVISFAEARRALIAASDDARGEAIAMIANSIHQEDMWSRLVVPFITYAWPCQLEFQGPASARAFAGLLEKAGDRFPEAVALVEPYLRPIPHLDMFAYRMKKRDDEGEGYSGRFPAESLKVLDAMVGPEPQTAPWNLRELLETIATASPALRQSDAWRRLRSIGQ